MSRRSDGALGLLAVGVFAGALLASDGTFSPPFAALGVAGTLAFEVVAFRNSETVRYYWERPAVQLGTFALALAIAGAGAIAAPSSVLSAGIGALFAYLAVLASVVAGAIDSDESSNGKGR